MRVLLVGMHRSGTSALARVLNLMGLYLGEEAELMPPKPDNPAGFWERVDVHQLNEEIFASLGTTWHTVSEADVERLPAVARRRFEERAGEIVRGLDRHRPWLVKDPRLCVLLPLWRTVLADPATVLIVRRPLQVAQSIAARNGFALPVGVALWEEHTVAALRHTATLPRILVTHHDLMARPVEVAGRLFEWLRAVGVEGVQPAPAAAVAEFIHADLFRARGDEETESPYLNPGRRQLLRSLLDGSALSDPPPEVSADARDTLAAHRVAAANAEELRRTRDERDAVTAERDLLETERDAARADLAQVVPQCNALFSEKTALLAERDALFVEKTALVAERDTLVTLVAERDALFSEKNTFLAERDALFLEKNALLTQLDAVQTERNQLTVAGEALQATNLHLGRETERLGVDLERERERVAQLREQLGTALSSRDYRLGHALLRPVRAIRRTVSGRRRGRG